METSLQRSQTTPSIASSYSRISGGTPIISVGSAGGSGPKFKSKKESALERYEAERAVREAEEDEKIAKDPSYKYLKDIRDMQANAVMNAFEDEKKAQSRFFQNNSQTVGGGNKKPDSELIGRYLGQQQRERESNASRQAAAQRSSYRPPDYSALYK